MKPSATCCRFARNPADTAPSAKPAFRKCPLVFWRLPGRYRHRRQRLRRTGGRKTVPRGTVWFAGIFAANEPNRMCFAGDCETVVAKAVRYALAALSESPTGSDDARCAALQVDCLRATGQHISPMPLRQGRKQSPETGECQPTAASTTPPGFRSSATTVMPRSCNSERPRRQSPVGAAEMDIVSVRIDFDFIRLKTGQ